jgi:hypothetical protein
MFMLMLQSMIFQALVIASTTSALNKSANEGSERGFLGAPSESIADTGSIDLERLTDGEGRPQDRKLLSRPQKKPARLLYQTLRVRHETRERTCTLGSALRRTLKSDAFVDPLTRRRPCDETGRVSE